LILTRRSRFMGPITYFIFVFLLVQGAKLRGEPDAETLETDVPVEPNLETNALMEASASKLATDQTPASAPSVTIPLSASSPPSSVIAPAGPALVQPQYSEISDDDAAGQLPPGIQYPGGAGDEPKDKLDLALDAVSEDIISKSKQISEENKWVTDVKSILQTYNNKLQRVDNNVNHLRRQVQELYVKKKQIENLKLQKILQSKLADAHDDLSKMQSALLHVKSKATEILQSKEDIQKTISGIESELTELKGTKEKGAKGDKEAKEAKGQKEDDE